MAGLPWSTWLRSGADSAAGARRRNRGAAGDGSSDRPAPCVRVTGGRGHGSWDVAGGCDRCRVVAMAIAGRRLFAAVRAHRERREGGWLFGMAFGFVVWTAGAVLILPIVSGGVAPAGHAGAGRVPLACTVGRGPGAPLLPFVHRPLHKTIESEAERPSSGPSGRLPRSKR